MASHLSGLHFRWQRVIHGFVEDYSRHSARLVVKVDRGLHADQREYDAARRRPDGAPGLQMRRVTSDEIRRNLPAVLVRISSAAGTQLAAAKAGEAGSPLPATGNIRNGWRGG
ncbi:MAG: DUF559 domain-containing protein [Chloroflexi bacterium]|nr:DUF559 domain-containing protein [Chloroflexota bacterium]